MQVSPVANIPVMETQYEPTGVTPSGKTLNFDQLYVGSTRRWRTAIGVAYVVVAIIFALYTPPWQMPDEPAHYNYIAHIAENGDLPILQQGDYDQPYIELLVRTRFPAQLSTTGLRYESYQPPLYYITAVPVYWATGGSLIAIRLFGVLLGLISLELLYACIALVFPGKHLLALTAMAFAALLPMHVSMTAAVNNDSLAKLLLMAATLIFLRWMRSHYFDYGYLAQWQQRRLLFLGILLGLGMLTKIYAYMMVPLFAAAVLLLIWLPPRLLGQTADGIQTPNRIGSSLRSMLYLLLPAALLGLPMWIRNLRLYGNWDILALSWHDTVVVGQLRTIDLIRRMGWIAYSEQGLDHTLKSFWGVFGWMGVFMDSRIYMALLVFGGVLFLGLIWAIVRLILGAPDADMSRFQMSVLGLFGLMLVLVIGSYIAYNVKFVQHQGRYLFWGLLPISAFVALAWREVLHPLQGLTTGFLGLVLTLALALSGLTSDHLDKWTLLILGSTTMLLLLQPLLLSNSGYIILDWLPDPLQHFLTRRPLVRLFSLLRTVCWALPFFLLFLLNLLIPMWFLLPQLSG